MTANKKTILVALSLLLIPSILLGIGIGYVAGLNWIPIALGLVGIQWYASYWIDKNKQIKAIETALTKYDSLEFKKYLIPLKCQECGRDNSVEMDLSSTEFKCIFCKRKNAIYVNFSTASLTEPLMDLRDVVANAT